MRKYRFIYHWLILFVFIFSTQTSCKIQLISAYDETTDKGVIALEEKVSALLYKIEEDIPVDTVHYKKFIERYQEIFIMLNSLEVRANAIEKNRIVTEQLESLKMMVDQLKNLHKMGFMDRAQIKPLRKNFNTTFTAITKLQLALKRGEK